MHENNLVQTVKKTLNLGNLLFTQIKIEVDRNRDTAQMLTIEKEKNSGIDCSKVRLGILV